MTKEQLEKTEKNLKGSYWFINNRLHYKVIKKNDDYYEIIVSNNPEAKYAIGLTWMQSLTESICSLAYLDVENLLTVKLF